MSENMGQDILENAISSLREGLTKYKSAVEGVGDQSDQYKFAIMHFIHFFELSLKHYLASLQPLLIYQKPFDERLATDKRYEVNTITADQAVQILINNGVNITSEFDNNLTFIKTIRNQIMHSRFSFNPKAVDKKLGRLAKAFVELNEKVLDIELESWLSEEEYSVFEKLYTHYLANLSKAMDLVAQSKKRAYEGRRIKERDQVNWNCYVCPSCNEKALIPCEDSQTGYKCAFCYNEESDEIEVGCPVCGGHPTLSSDDEGAERFYCAYHRKKLLGK